MQPDVIIEFLLYPAHFGPKCADWGTSNVIREPRLIRVYHPELDVHLEQIQLVIIGGLAVVAFCRSSHGLLGSVCPGPVTHKKRKEKGERVALIFLPQPVWEPSQPLLVMPIQKQTYTVHQNCLKWFYNVPLGQEFLFIFTGGLWKTKDIWRTNVCEPNMYQFPDCVSVL